MKEELGKRTTVSGTPEKIKELNEMSLEELFILQRQLGKAIEQRVRIGEDIRKRAKK